ncbi:MAG: glycosyltransferase family 4 protein [Anaerolineaceae bacterium]|nr:glycosyltransferase family 4 protein [Anaerolineaceae bacterium]
MRERIPILGELIGRYYEWLEQTLLKKSDHIVLITDGFQPIMEKWGISITETTVIPNWAPIENLSPKPKDNQWSREHQLTDQFCFMYTGTLGMKHNPGLLVDLAVQYQNKEQVIVVVISEGPGAEWLQKEKQEKGLENLILFPYQPFDRLPLVMGTADVLLALLEPDAGVFSVPSKVLSYLCAQRPILLAVPRENLAAQIVESNLVGFVVPPNDNELFIKNSIKLFEDKELRDKCAKNGRVYAERNFDIDQITDKFEKIFNNL